jgi:hypothetical protein
MPNIWSVLGVPLLGDQTPLPQGIFSPTVSGGSSSVPQSTPSPQPPVVGLSAPPQVSGSMGQGAPASLPMAAASSQSSSASFYGAKANEEDWEYKCGAYEVWVTVKWGKKKPKIDVRGRGPYSCSPRPKRGHLPPPPEVPQALPMRPLDAGPAAPSGTRILRLKFERVQPVQESNTSMVILTGSLDSQGKSKGIGDAYSGSKHEIQGKAPSGPVEHLPGIDLPKPSGHTIVLPLTIVDQHLTFIEVNLDFGDLGDAGGGDRPKPKEEQTPSALEQSKRQPPAIPAHYGSFGMPEEGAADISDSLYSEDTGDGEYGSELNGEWVQLDGTGISSGPWSESSLGHVGPRSSIELDASSRDLQDSCSRPSPWTILDICVDPLSPDGLEAISRMNVRGSRMVTPVQGPSSIAQHIPI